MGIVHDDDYEDPRQKVLNEQNNERMEQQQQLETIEDLKQQIEELQKENDTKDELIKDAKQREMQSKEELVGMGQQMTQWREKCENAESKMDAMNDAMVGKENEQNNERMEQQQ